MKTQLLVACILFVTTLFGQTFEYEYSTPDDDKIWDVIEAEDGNLYCAGFVATPYSNKYKGFIQRINAEGQLIDTRIIDVENQSCELTGILQDTAGSFVICGSLSDTTEEHYNAKMLFLRLNYALQTIDSNTITVTPDREAWPILAKNIGFNNEFLYSGGLYRENQGVHLFLLKINQSLDSLLYVTEKGTFGIQIRQLTDSTYWTVEFSANCVVWDSEFNMIDWSKLPSHFSQPYGCKWDSDTSFYALAQWDENNDHEIGMLKMYDPLDTTGLILQTWGVEDKWDYPAPSGALDFNNKDSIYAGIISPVGIWAPYPSNYVVLQTDSMLNIRWERFYGEGNYYYELMKVIATKDGGCLLAGTRYNYYGGDRERDIYIIKLDNKGLIVGESEHPEINMQEALVFPNPGSTVLKVRIAAQYPASTIKLYDLNGRKVLEQSLYGRWATINSTFLPKGTYIYKITAPSGLVENGKWIKQ